jgi:hypothetical protein
MIKAFLWVLFILHTLTISIYVALGLLKKVPITQLNLTILSICGILITLTFSELILRELHEKRKNRKAD